MKWILFFLLVPCSAMCQTAHLDDDGKIFYKGTIKTDVTPAKLFEATRQAFAHTKDRHSLFSVDSSSNSISVASEMKLLSSQGTINTLRYQVKLKREDAGAKYTIDSVVLVRRERGVGTTIMSSEDLVKGMEITGPFARQTEKQLNEIDMKFQRLLDLLKLYLEQ